MKNAMLALCLRSIMISLTIVCSGLSDSSFIASRQSDEPEISSNVLAIYAPVLESWRSAIGENFGYSEETPDVKTYPYICQALPNEFKQMRYAYYDIDDNGTAELFIATFHSLGYYHIADVFAIYDAKPIRLFEGVEDRGFWSRNWLDFSQDGKSLIVRASGGAPYTDIDFYKISENGYQVERIEGLTTYNPDDLDDFTPYYHLPDGTHKIADDMDKIVEKYYDKRYLDEEHFEHFSDFHMKLEWYKIV